MSTTQQPTATPLEFSDVQHISVEALKGNFADGTMSYCPSEIYIRRKPLSDEQLATKKSYLVSDVDGEKVVQIREPLLFFTSVADGNFGDNLKLLNGNNRVRCEFLLLLTNPEYTFLPVPYRVITSVPTVSQLIECQDSLNDSGDKHTIIDRAIAITRQQKRLEELYKDSGLKQRQLAKRITEEVMATFRCKSQAEISNALKLISLPEFVLEVIEKDELAPTIAVNITRSFEKKEVPTEQIWQEYFDYASRNELKLGVPSADEFLSVVYPVENTDTTSEDSTQDSESGTGSKSKSNSGSSEKLPKAPVTAEEFTSKLTGSLSTLYVIEPEHIKPEHSEQVTSLVKNSFAALSKLQAILSPSDSLKVLETVKQLVTTLAGDPSYLVSRAETTEMSLADVLSILAPISKSVNNLYKTVYQPEPEEQETPPESKAEVTEMKIDDVEVSVF